MTAPRDVAPLFGPALAAGDVVGARFRVERLAGAGGMGEVYLARELASGAPVAVKVTRQSVEDEARFLREAALLESLRDPGIVAYLGHGRLADGRPFLAMEWLEGESLADRLVRGPLPLEEVVPLVRSIARALGAAHRRGIVHRDVKPSNVFLLAEDTAGPRVRLIDFGIARHTVLRGATITKTDAAIGTPHYMAPEQVRGARDVGPTADVFSLGCLLYECVAGRGPFVSDTLLAALAAVLLEDPEPLRRHAPAASPELERLTLTMLSKDASLRPADGDAVVAALDRLLTTLAPSSPSRAGPDSTGGLSRREQRLVLVLVALPSEERRAVEATQRADEADPTTLRLRGIVERSEGRVELSAEGALVASFLDDGATRDRVERAIRCARRMLESDPGARVGLVAGRAVSGRVPVGEAVERAIVLARAAGPDGAGGAGLDDDVASFAAAEHVLERVVVPGGPSFARLGAARRAGENAPRRARLFGRDRELAALSGSAREALEEPIARVLLVSGEPGIGRTSVLEHLVARVAAEHAERDPEGPPLRVLRVRAQPSDREAPLSLSLRLVRAAAGVEEGEPLSLRRERLAAHVAALEPPSARAAELVRDLGDLARIPVDDELRVDAHGDSFLRGDLERRAFHEWASLLAREPLLLAIDDAHHADPVSLELLADVLERLASRPLLVVLTARTDERSQTSGLERELGRANPEVHRLGPLLPRAARALLEHLLSDVRGVSEDARAELAARGEGNPFFLRELSAARSRGAEAPVRLLAAVEERILRVPEESRRALRAVALLGEPSALEVIRDLVPGLDERELEARVEELARAELVELEGAGAARRVRPRSALVADAAYAMIPDEDRRLAHRGAGLGLRARGAEPARIAHHLERGGELAAAAEACRDAADRALEAHDLTRAEVFAARGFELASRVPDAGSVGARALSGELALCRAQAARWSADYALAFHRAEEALSCLEPSRGSDARLSHRFMEALGVSLAASSALGRAEPFERAEALLLGALPPFADDRDVRAAEVVTLCRGAAAWLGRGERARADRWLERARARAGEAPLPIAGAWLHVLAASRALHDGDLAAFLADTERAIGAYERAGDARNACNQRVRLANALVSVGELGRAEPLLVTARDDAERMGLSLIAGYAVQNLGNVLALRGREAEARASLEDALSRARRLGDARLLAGAHLYLALLELRRDPALALEHASNAREALGTEGPLRAIARAVEARAACSSGDLPRALSASAEASAWLEAHGPIEEGEAAIHRARADVLLASGDQGAAGALARHALVAIEARARALPAALRTGYLEGHPDHVRLRALASHA